METCSLSTYISLVMVKVCTWNILWEKITQLITECSERFWLSVLFTDFSFKNWKDALPDNPGEILLSAASDQLMEHLGLAGYLKKDQCSSTPTPSTVKGWNDGK